LLEEVTEDWLVMSSGEKGLRVFFGGVCHGMIGI